MIVGATGRLGSEIAKLLPSALKPTKNDFNILDAYGMEWYLVHKNIDTIINCTGATDTVRCEKEPTYAYDLNVIGVAKLVNLCQRYGIKLVHISTDHIFDGKKGMYKETDKPNPKGHYANSKWIGELYVQTLKKYLLIRTSFMKDFGFDAAFEDKYWSGDWVDRIAPKIVDAIKMNLRGIYHIGTERKSIYDFVKTRYPDIKPISLKDNPRGRCGLKYLRDTSLDITKWKNEWNSYYKSSRG